MFEGCKEGAVSSCFVLCVVLKVARKALCLSCPVRLSSFSQVTAAFVTKH